MLNIKLKNPLSAVQRAETIVNCYCRRPQDLDVEVDSLDVFTAIRAMIAEGKISENEVTFSYEDKPVTVNRFGAVQDWPRTLFRESLDIAGKLVRMAKIRRDAEKEKS